MSVTQRILSSRFAVPILTGVLYTFATLNFIRYYVVSTQFYLDMPRYLAGRERLPFQERVLPIVLMWPINHSAALMRIFAERAETHAHSLVPTVPAATPRTGAFYILALLSFAIAGYFTTRLYRAVTETGLLAPLVFPFFLVVTLWTYVVHIDANFSYPYDLPSLAFFTAGIFCIYTRRFLPLPFIVFFGTMNREQPCSSSASTSSTPPAPASRTHTHASATASPLPKSHGSASRYFARFGSPSNSPFTTSSATTTTAKTTSAFAKTSAA